jgi:hypothetical protein
MGTPLTGITIASGYPGYLKTGDNLALTTSKLLSDGLGNDAALTLGAAGGASTFSGTLTSTGNFTVGASTFTVAAASGNTVVGGTLSSAGNFAVATTRFTVDAATGNTAVAGTLNVTGACVFTATGSFGGNLSTSQTLTCRAFVQNDVAGSNSLSGSLTVGGVATFNGSVQFNSSVSFAQPATFSGGISSPTITATSTSALGSASAGSLTTTGAVNCGGNLTVTGNATFNGNTTVGDAAGDSFTLNAATWTTPNLASKATPVGADTVLIRDSADSNRVKTALVSAIRPTVWDSGNISLATLYAWNNTGGVAQITGAHTLGANPVQFDAFLECVTANNGFSIGDRVPLSSVWFTTWGNAFYQLTVNASSWYLTTNVGGNVSQIMNRNTGGIVTFNPTEWNLRLFLRLI